MDNNYTKWIALFSQTGNEICEIVNNLCEAPDLVITNNTKATTWDKRIFSLYPLCAPASLINDYIVNLPTDTKILVTLHGYNRILPPKIVDNVKFDIYNLHPGDIIKYPELKGKDPQAKALELKLPSTGCVLHRVTNELDSGEILYYNELSIANDATLDTLCADLKQKALLLWLEFFKGKK
jgi:folate-dependent phosphoribosylglycinamide formyltransferase PurN